MPSWVSLSSLTISGIKCDGSGGCGLRSVFPGKFRHPNPGSESLNKTVLRRKVGRSTVFILSFISRYRSRRPVLKGLPHVKKPPARSVIPADRVSAGRLKAKRGKHLVFPLSYQVSDLHQQPSAKTLICGG